MGRKNANVKHSYTHARNREAMMKYASVPQIQEVDSTCFKKAYSDEISAKIAAVEQGAGHAYHCPQCQLWHLKTNRF